tara:strand:- start:90 stop:335 length:246 start_codon:yes stop_codon:yes gene_type:complete
MEGEEEEEAAGEEDEVVDAEDTAADVEEVSSLTPFSPVPSLMELTKVAGRRFHLFQFCAPRWRQTLVRAVSHSSGSIHLRP